MVDVAGRELRLVKLRRGMIRREPWTFFYRGEGPKKSNNRDTDGAQNQAETRACT